MKAGPLLRHARRHARISQRELAERAGVPASRVAHVEAGRVDPPLAVLTLLLRCCGLGLAPTMLFPTAPDPAAALAHRRLPLPERLWVGLRSAPGDPMANRGLEQLLRRLARPEHRLQWVVIGPAARLAWEPLPPGARMTRVTVCPAVGAAVPEEPLLDVDPQPTGTAGFEDLARAALRVSIYPSGGPLLLIAPPEQLVRMGTRDLVLPFADTRRDRGGRRPPPHRDPDEWEAWYRDTARPAPTPLRRPRRAWGDGAGSWAP